MIDASVIIPTYNRKEILEKSLGALLNQSYPKDSYEIILVDDGSTDGTDRMISSLSPSCELRYIRNQRRLGQSISRNKGINSAKGKYIIFVDSDIIVVPEFIREHIRYHTHQENLIVNGELIYISNIEQVGKKKKSLWDISFSPFDTANVSVKKKNLKEVGGFDENLLPYGWQDIELGYRLKKTGLKNRKNKKALGYHFRGKGGSFGLDFLKEKEFMRGASGALFFKKHPYFGVKMAVKGNPLFVFSFIGRWLDKTPRGKKFFSRIQEKRAGKLHALLSKLILCHYYVKGYSQKINEKSLSDQTK